MGSAKAYPNFFAVVETTAFTALAADYGKEDHKKLSDDLHWLKGRLAEVPEQMGGSAADLGRC